MPSTFTGNTGIEKIADGEQTGAWGQTTNLNFDIVDRALNGSVNVTLSGTTHTLTTSNGLLSDGQFAVLVFTGSPSGTNTVTIDPNTAQKTYVVRNTTNQSVVLSQGSGASVTVPAGLTKFVYADGGGATAAVVDITNTLSGTFTGNVTGNVTGNASTATALQTARTIGGVSFNGTANINLPGVNQAGNQNTTGNATTATLATSATALQTARTINGVSFDGTANITLPTVNTSGNQTIDGTKTFSAAVVLSTAGTTTTQAVRADRTIATGTGLSGGGDLTANRTLSITNGGIGSTQLAASERMTTGNVLAQTADASVGAIGTYAFLWDSVARTNNEGQTRSGSDLRYAATSAGTSASYRNSSPSGTWRVMGVTGYDVGTTSTATQRRASVWLRIS